MNGYDPTTINDHSHITAQVLVFVISAALSNRIDHVRMGEDASRRSLRPEVHHELRTKYSQTAGHGGHSLATRPIARHPGC